jgi:Tfp pilus assembly protein PilX
MTKTLEQREAEQGSVLVIALMILVLLTVIGISATTTTDIETLIARNEQEYVREFYVADSAWRQGVQWLDTRAAVPPMLNRNLISGNLTDDPDYLNVRNYGDGGSDVTALSTDATDGTLGSGSNALSYWYKVAYFDTNSLAGSIVPGSGKNFRKFNFRVRSNANQQRQIEITVTKVFKTGY